MPNKYRLLTSYHVESRDDGFENGGGLVLMCQPCNSLHSLHIIIDIIFSPIYTLPIAFKKKVFEQDDVYFTAILYPNGIECQRCNDRRAIEVRHKCVVLSIL